MNLKVSKEGYIGGFRGRKEKREIMQLYYILKSKRNKTKRTNQTKVVYFFALFNRMPCLI